MDKLDPCITRCSPAPDNSCGKMSLSQGLPCPCKRESKISIYCQNPPAYFMNLPKYSNPQMLYEHL